MTLGSPVKTASQLVNDYSTWKVIVKNNTRNHGIFKLSYAKHDYYSLTTLWLFNIAMENGTFIDGLPIKNGDFPWLC